MPPGASPYPQGENRGQERKYATDTFYSKMIETKVVPGQILGKSCHKCRFPPGPPLAPRGENRGHERKYALKTFNKKNDCNKSCNSFLLMGLNPQTRLLPSRGVNIFEAQAFSIKSADYKMFGTRFCFLGSTWNMLGRKSLI